MNSTPALAEERRDTSSVEIGKVSMYRIPHAPLECFQGVVTSTTLVFAFDPEFYLITAPRTDINGLYKTSTAIPKTEIVYKSPESVEALLGDEGKHVLEKVIGLIENASQKQDWPLTRVEVNHVEDAQVENWQYVLIVLIFDCNFDAADEYLHNFYEQLDSLTDVLGNEEQNILQRKLFFDVETTV